MTYLVGAILLSAFLLFALLMFLERISALLALPLMAVAFLVIAVGADISQPPEVTTLVGWDESDAYGRLRVVTDEQMVTSRFEEWKQTRIRYAELLRNKTALLGEAIETLRKDLEGAPAEAKRWLLADISVQLERLALFESETATAVDRLPTFFDRPPHYNAQSAAIERKLGEIALRENLLAIVSLLEDEPPAEAVPRVAETLAQMHARWQAFDEQYGTVPDIDGSWFRLSSALRYLGGYLMLVLQAGSLHLYTAIIATVFGGMFAMYVKNLKVAERLVYWTAEFAGERPFVIALAVFLVTAVIFTSVGGLGTVIMIGTIILPILRSVGLSPIVGAGVFLIALSMGGTLDPVSRRLWMELFSIPGDRLNGMLWTMVALYATVGVLWIWWGSRRSLLSSFDAAAAEKPARDDVPARLMIAPLIPVGLVYFAGVAEIPAFVASLVYMFMCVSRRRGAVRVFARSLIEGAQVVMPPVLLMLGIGMLLVSLMTAPVQHYLRPLIAAAVPETQTGYIAVFALAAPLALYRGPLNRWGMGLAIAGILLANTALAPAAILGVILAAGMVQGVCDPTNTYNVWIAGFQGVTVNQILRYTIVPIWLAAAAAIITFGMRFVG